MSGGSGTMLFVSWGVCGRKPRKRNQDHEPNGLLCVWDNESGGDERRLQGGGRGVRWGQVEEREGGVLNLSR